MDRIEEIRENTQIDARAMNREPTCNTTHYPGCDCQVQRYIREKLDLLSTIDHLRSSQKELLEAVDRVTINLGECRSDHHGNCQAHFLEHDLDGCSVRHLKEVAEKVRE